MIRCKNCGFELTKKWNGWGIAHILNNEEYLRNATSYDSFCIVDGTNRPHEPIMKLDNFKTLYGKLTNSD